MGRLERFCHAPAVRRLQIPAAPFSLLPAPADFSASDQTDRIFLRNHGFQKDGGIQAVKNVQKIVFPGQARFRNHFRRTELGMPAGMYPLHIQDRAETRDPVCLHPERFPLFPPIQIYKTVRPDPVSFPVRKKKRLYRSGIQNIGHAVVRQIKRRYIRHIKTRLIRGNCW